jgi:Fe-S-cluster containining protein
VDDDTLPAGDFSAWVRSLQGALGHEAASDVPCGSCTACCSSSQFVHIDPDETDTLAHIPGELLFPAPRLPAGHVLLGYDDDGRCPLLGSSGCSIYDHRPRTCRTYDCRVFTAADVEVDDPDKALIAERVRRWRFSYPTETDRVEHDAVRAAALFLDDHPELSPHGGTGPATSTGRAVAAVAVHDVFLDHGSEPPAIVRPEPEMVAVAFSRRPGPVPRAHPAGPR